MSDCWGTCNWTNVKRTHSCIRPFPVLTLPRIGVQALEAVSNLTEASTCSVILQLPSILACVTELLFLDYSEEWPLIPFITCNLSTPLPPRSTLGLTCLVLTLELAQTFHRHSGYSWFHSPPWLKLSTLSSLLHNLSALTVHTLWLTFVPPSSSEEGPGCSHPSLTLDFRTPTSLICLQFLSVWPYLSLL